MNAFDGEVESLATAEIEGVGVRVIADGREGYAWAGSLDPDVVADTLADARDNAGFGAPDEFYALATPADFGGVTPPDLDLWRDDVLSVATAEKVVLAIELESMTKSLDARIKALRSASYGDAVSESAVANSNGVEMANRRTMCSVSVYAMAEDESGTQTGGGYSMGRGFADLDLSEAAHDAVERAVRLLGVRNWSRGGSRWCSTPRSRGRSCPSSARRCRRRRSRRVDRCSSVARASRSPRRTSRWSTTRRWARRSGRPRTTPKVCRPAGWSWSPPATSSPSCTTCTPPGGAARSQPAPPSAPVSSRSRASAPAHCTWCPGRCREEILGSVPEALFVQSVSGLHSGTNPVSGDFSVGAEGLMVRNGELAEPVREITIASTLQRMLQDVVHVGADLEWLPGGAAGMTLLIGEMSVAGK